MEEIRTQIIIRFLQKELPEKEIVRLIAWRKAKPENEQQFQEIKFLWEKAHKAAPANEISINKKAALEKVRRKIAPAKVVPMRRRFFLRAAAAAVVLLIGASVGYNLFFSQPEMIHLATTAGETREVTLPDDSKVWMLENSELSYAAKFSNATRNIQMIGEAIFEVTPNKSKPFIVKSNDLAVTVLGTKFNVHSPKGGKKSEVHVLHGKVKVAQKVNAKNHIILTKGMTADFNKETKTLALNENYSPNHLFDVTGILVFKNQKLESVLAEIETAYKVKLNLTNKQMLNCPFTGNFEDQNIDEVLDILQTLYDFEITTQDSSTFKITRGLCN